jgi:predicted small metal-binding protein
VIPEGALHAHKHNLEKINEDLKGNITHKGIPVVSVDDEGNIE